MGTPRWLAACALISAALSLSGQALGDVAAAEVLFNDGRRLLMEGKLDQACEKLGESQRLDPSSGTLLNLALCHEKQGKLATAWGEYTAAARLARAQSRQERARTADDKAAELEPRLPKLTIVVSAPVPGIEITRGAERVGSGGLGTSTPVDPGQHVIKASAPGYVAWETTVELAEADLKEVTVPELQRDPETAEPPVAQAAPAPAPAPIVQPVAPPPADAERSAAEGGSLVGWLIAGAGAVTLGAGAYFGVQSLRAYDRAETACPTNTGCPQGAIDDRDAAERDAWIANVAIPVGLVGIAVGGYLVLSSGGDAAKPEMAVGVAPVRSGALVGWSGSF